MNNIIKERRAKWAAALRSGKYKQGIGRLRRDDKFCCLGVACDLYAKKQWEKMKDGYHFRTYYSVWPLCVEDYYGSNGEETQKLINLNDGNFSFEKIADYIEENTK